MNKTQIVDGNDARFGEPQRSDERQRVIQVEVAKLPGLRQLLPENALERRFGVHLRAAHGDALVLSRVRCADHRREAPVIRGSAGQMPEQVVYIMVYSGAAVTSLIGEQVRV